MNRTSIGITEASKVKPLPQTHRVEDCACLQLRMASRAVTRLFDKIIEPSGLKATQFSFLAAIDEAGEATVGGLAAHLVMDSSTVARNLKPLEKAGLIAVRAAEDRRYRIVRLTRKGVIKLAEAMPFWCQAHETLEGLVGSETISANSQNLRQFVDSIAARPRDGEG